MSGNIAKPVNGSYGVINGVEITEEVIARLVKNAEEGFPGAKFRAPGRPARTNEPSRAVTVRLSESELAALVARADREQRTRSEAIRAAIAEWASAA
ncbi:ribbon-helix-helix protein, CopG family [Leucobacter insecticola]|uniref:Ribbon-helix-helix protein, CopG family n=1 Tax=Leucobacter insecticola TaxID=2714934 RepID=A0A6G8FI89_9MICO|nr:ribbon-helix-helix protein, CopG family [Leucobacter insecticola]QIM15762.1 ribbon-helix-helix protein, CopG family [Leucobacter insecticola]